MFPIRLIWSCPDFLGASGNGIRVSEAGNWGEARNLGVLYSEPETGGVDFLVKIQAWPRRGTTVQKIICCTIMGPSDLLGPDTVSAWVSCLGLQGKRGRLSLLVHQSGSHAPPLSQHGILPLPEVEDGGRSDSPLRGNWNCAFNSSKASWLTGNSCNYLVCSD